MNINVIYLHSVPVKTYLFSFVALKSILLFKMQLVFLS